MNRYVFVLSFAVIVLLAVVIAKWRDLSTVRSLQNLIAWSVLPDDHIRCNLPLYAYLFNAQIELAIAEPYRLAFNDDLDYVKIILSKYKEDLVTSYFKGVLKVPKGKYVFMGKDYFFFTLQSFLDDFQCERTIAGMDMHQKTLSYKSHGSWGVPLYDAVYSLTDFAVVYHKIYYIAYLYCKNSKVINPSGQSFNNADIIQEILDTKQMHLSQY